MCRDVRHCSLISIFYNVLQTDEALDLASGDALTNATPKYQDTQEDKPTKPSGGGEAQLDSTPQHPTDEGDTARLTTKRTPDKENILYPGRRNTVTKFNIYFWNI